MSKAAALVATGNGKAPDMDIEALLRSSRRPERTVPICLRGDLVAEFEELDRQLAEETAKAKTIADTDRRLNSNPYAAAQRVAEAMAVLREQMAAATVAFRLRALPPARWAALRNEHPPRKGEDGKTLESDSVGINIDTFFEPLIRESIVYPALSEQVWEMLMGRAEPTEDDPDADKRGLSDGQIDSLGGAAWWLNRREVDIPFSRAASRMMQSSGSE